MLTDSGARGVAMRILVPAMFALCVLPAIAHPQSASGGVPLQLEPCTLPSPIGEVDALCGSLEVPEDPQSAGGRTIELNIVVLPALDGGLHGTPLFELAGGPGIPVTGAAALYAGPLSGYRRNGPVVLVDRRGTGGSGALHCTALAAADPLGPLYPLDQVRACRDELQSQVDLRRYGSELAAHDIDRVRAALDHDRIDLWGLSYGTILGQTYMRLFPDRVRRAVFTGVAPVDLRTPLLHATSAQRALDLVFFDCQLDADCSAAYPDLRQEWQALLQRLDQGPVRVEPAAGGVPGDSVEIRRGPFAEELRGMLGVAALQRQLPLVIHSAAHGDFEPFLSHVRTGPSPYALGLYLSVACSQGGARISDADVHRHTAGTFLGDYRVREELAACAEWPTAPVHDSFFALPEANVPVLMISGDMDHVTPPHFAAGICARLPSCRQVVVPHLAHGPFDLDEWTGGDCFDRLAIEFLASPDPDLLDISCVRAMQPPPFVLPPDRPAADSILRTPDAAFDGLPGFPFEPRYTTVGGGLRVHYLDEGPADGDVVVLLHGEPTWSYLYRDMIPPLAEAGFRVIAPDLVGFGRSDKPRDRSVHTYAQHVAWMSELLFERLQLEQVTLFAQDWGGLIGLRVVADHPDRFARVVIANTGLPTGDQPIGDAFMGWLAMSQGIPVFDSGAIVQAASATNLPDDVVAAYNAPFPDESYKAGPRAMPALVPIRPDQAGAAENRRAWERLREFDRPFLTLFSDQDPITRGWDAAFVDAVPGARGQPHATIRNGGHFLQEDAAAELAARLIEFMRLR